MRTGSGTQPDGKGFPDMLVQRIGALILAAMLASPAVAQEDLYAAWLIDPSNSSGPSMQVWRESTSSRSFTWRLLAGDGALLAEQKQPAIPRGYSLNFGQCKVGDELRDDVLAIVKHGRTREWSGDVRAVWVADPKARAFVPMPVRGVVCRDEGFGL